jgi:tetratricopeptide (TPR) repeat protein
VGGLQAQPAAKVDPKTARMFDVQIRAASAAYELRDFEKATKHLDEAEALIPGKGETINLRGAVFYKQKKYDEAMACYQTLIAMDPNGSYPGYFNSAEVLLAQKKYDEALALFERILEARPADEACQLRIVLVLAYQGKMDEARRRAGKIPNPGQTAAYYFANAAIDLIAGKRSEGLAWIKKSEVFFPAETSTALRDVLVERELLPK